MKINQLDLKPSRRAKRLGRGISAGQGKTAGRGTKGQKSRTGSSKKPGFAGGTNPLMQQLPKLPGFRSYRTKAEIVKLSQIESIKSKIIDANVLAENKLISNPYVSLKLIGTAKLSSAITVKLPLASKSAVESIQSAGGSFDKVARLQRAKKSKEPAKN